MVRTRRWMRVLAIGAIGAALCLGLIGCDKDRADDPTAIRERATESLPAGVTRYPYTKVGSVARSATEVFLAVGSHDGGLGTVVREPLDGSTSTVVYTSVHDQPNIASVHLLDDDHLVVEDARADSGSETRIALIRLSTGETTDITFVRPGDAYIESVDVAGGRVYWQEVDDSDPAAPRVTLVEWDPASGATSNVGDFGSNTLTTAGTAEHLYYIPYSADGGTIDVIRRNVSSGLVEAIQGVEGQGWWVEAGDAQRVILASGDPEYEGLEVVDVVSEDGSISHSYLDIGENFHSFQLSGQRLGALVTSAPAPSDQPEVYSLFTLHLASQQVSSHPLEIDGVPLTADSYYLIDEETAVVFARTPTVDSTDPSTGMYRFVIPLGPIGSAG